MVVDSYISFLVPTLGERPNELNRLFDSLKKQTINDFEIIVVAQDNFENVEALCNDSNTELSVKVIKNKERGLSKARNAGIPYCRGTVIIFSDDDCWYPSNAVEIVLEQFKKQRIDVLLTKIYDLQNDKEYKRYGNKEEDVKSVFQLMSKSSIEIAVRNRFQDVCFDENFGLGAQYICCEEVDYLIRLYRMGAYIKYLPEISVYHEKKYIGSTRKQVVAKGALYSKYFNFIVGFLICLKDLIRGREKNFKPFFEGFYGYKKIKRKNKITNSVS